MARPCKTLESSRICELAAKGHSIKGIAAMLGVSYDTLHRRYANACETGKELMRTELRAKQFEVAMKGNPIMLIWLGKQELEQRDKQEIDVHKQMTVRMVVGIEQSELNTLANGYWADNKELPTDNKELPENTFIETSTNEQKEQNDG